MKILSLYFNTADTKAPYLLVSSDDVVGRIREHGDAKDILRACNSHDILVDLLRDISGTMQSADPMKERIIQTLAKASA